MITVTVDKLGRDIAVIPDTDAARLAAAIKNGWTEIPELADGYSRPFPPGTWVHEVTIDILTMITLCGSTPRVRSEATRGMFYGFIVGQSGWNPAEAWWADFPATTHLRVGAYPRVENGTVVYAG
jgi:hypothetical protein